ncbi:DUF1049 domain-containing protein [Novosphingobium tardum]|uniref:DUF1049 domain-containing protein n=1 Tax=Novosphingobium tardum TaxID=1538021 RepID=A0ABV8RQT7_9SPHN
MQILRTILWVVIAVLIVLFAVNNWQPVEVRIWQTLILETKLAPLAIVAFLLGLVPMWLFHRAARWRWKRRIAQLESSLTDRTPAPPLVAPAPTPAPEVTPTPAVEPLP